MVRFLLLLLCSAPFATAQGTQATGPTGTSDATLRFLSLFRGETGDLWIRSGSEWIQPRAPSSFLAAPIDYSGPSELVFYRKQESEEGQPAYTRVGAATLPPGQGEWLLILASQKKGWVPPRVVNIDSQNFPNGTYRFFNLCDQMVGLKMDENLYRLPAGSIEDVRPKMEEPKPISVQFMKAGDLDRASLVTTTWFYNETQRKLVFFIPNGDKIEVRSLTLFPNPES